MLKFTMRLKRQIPHLMAYLMEDIDYALSDPQHPLYRRLKTKAEKEATMDLLRWLEEQAPAASSSLQSE